MSTEDEKNKWREQAEARLAEAEKEKQDEIHRQRLQLELRGEQKAAENKAAARKTARNIWVAEGGMPSEFEKQWEKMWDAMVYQRTLTRMSGDTPYSGKQFTPRL